MTPALLRPAERAGVGLCVAVMAFLTWQVTTGGFVVRLDEQVYTAVGATFSPWAELIGDIGSPELSGLVLTVAAVHTAFARGLWWPIVLAAGNGLGMAALVLVLKALTGREGPGSAPLDGYPGFFPSGHTATAAVCLGTAAFLVATVRRLPRRSRHSRRPMQPASGAAAIGIWVGLLVGALVGTMTVVSANHWVSDVVAGLALSAAVLLVGFAAIRRHFERE